MRLYKQKDIPKQHPNPPGHPPSSPSSSPGSPTPYKLRRAAEAVSKQISGHKAMVAQFKEMRLPRPPMFSTKPPTVPPKDRSLVPTQRKATKGPGEPQNVPEGFPIRTSAVTSNQRTTLPGVSTNSRSPAKPPGLGSEKATPSISSSAPRTAPSRSQSISPPVRSSWQRAAVKPTTSRYERTSPAVTLADHSVTSSTSVDLQQPILFVSCFHSFEDDSELEDEDDSLEEVELSSGFESQVAQIFSRGLGSMSDSDIIRHGEVSPPITTPAVTLAPMVEPMSAVVEWWEPEANTAATCDVAINVKSKDPVNASDEGADPIPCIASTRTGDIHDVTSSRPSVSTPRHPTSVVRFDIGRPRTVLCQPPSSADYEVVASLAKGAFGAVALAIHKQSGRQCAIKVISNVIVKEQSVIRTVLEEQRIMREASGHPFLLGLLASFHDAHGLYLISEYCRSTLFDERLHMPESYKKLASAELACAVDHIHSLGIVHRDIKLENVMLKNDGHVVLGDFGLAVRLESLGSPSRRRGGSVRVDRRNAVKTRGVCGTLPYMAPELLRNMEYSYGVDWFAYGVFLHVFYLDKFPWLSEYEHPVSYLKEMMSTISIGLVFKDGSFGDLLNKLFCIDQDARADFSVVRRATFFADFDWQSVIPVESPASFVSPRPVGDENPPLIRNGAHFAVDSDPYPDFTWLSPSMIIEEVTPELCDANWSYEPTITESSLSSDSDTPFCERSPALFGSLRFFNSFSLPRLFNHSSCNFDPEDPVNNALRNSVRPLDEGEDPVFTFPAEWVAVFRDSDSGVSLSQGTAAMPTHEDEEALVRTSIRSLDVGEEPVFELPSGWNESLVSPSDRAVPSSFQAQTTRRTSVLPKLKSLWKRATSKFAWR